MEHKLIFKNSPAEKIFLIAFLSLQAEHTVNFLSSVYSRPGHVRSLPYFSKFQVVLGDYVTFGCVGTSLVVHLPHNWELTSWLLPTYHRSRLISWHRPQEYDRGLARYGGEVWKDKSWLERFRLFQFCRCWSMILIQCTWSNIVRTN